MQNRNTLIDFAPKHLRILAWLIVALAAWPPTDMHAQRFQAGIIAGLTASQIDGDASAGYHKLGLQGGLRGNILLTESQFFSVELLYTQRGCRSEADDPVFFKTTLHYAEIPVQWHWRIWSSDGGQAVVLNAGISYGRLLGNTNDAELGGGITAALPDLRRNSFCALGGLSIHASERIAFTFRYHHGINRLYDPFAKPGTNFANSLLERFLAFQAMYLL